jgi:hypothetical protein
VPVERGRPDVAADLPGGGADGSLP